MEKSTVVDEKTGKSRDSRFPCSHSMQPCSIKRISHKLILLYSIHLLLNRVRTSSGTFLARGRDKTIREIEKRISDFTFIPVGMWLIWYFTFPRFLINSLTDWFCWCYNMQSMGKVFKFCTMRLGKSTSLITTTSWMSITLGMEASG